MNDVAKLDFMRKNQGAGSRSIFIRMLLDKEWKSVNIYARVAFEQSRLPGRLFQISNDKFAYRRHDDQSYRIFTLEEIFSNIVSIAGKSFDPLDLNMVQKALDNETSTMFVEEWEKHPVWDGNFNQKVESK